jgi:hypothetical protein
MADKIFIKPKRRPKYSVMLILKGDYIKEGRPDKFEKEGNDLEKLILFAHRHINNQRRRVPWRYVSIWRNARFDPYEAGEMLFWTRLPD